MLRFVFLASGSGSNFESCVRYVKDNSLPVEIVGLISNSSKAHCHERAKKLNIKSYCLNGRDSDYDFKLAELLRTLEPDYIVLAGYLKTVSSELVKEYEHRIINIHPSLIPAFCGRGYYGSRVHKAVFRAGVKVSGATVHFVSAGLDEGPIIAQECVPIDTGDTPEDIAAKVLCVEHRILPKVIRKISENKIAVVKGKVEVYE